MSNEYERKSVVRLIFLLSIFLFLLSGTVYGAAAPPPAVILSSYTISGNTLTNEVITLHLVFANTSSSLDVHDVLISYKSASDLFHPAYGASNQFFIPLIRAASTVNYDLDISVNNMQPNDGLYFDFYIEFSDTVNGINTNTFFISDSVKKENALQLLGLDTTDINFLSRDEIIISFKSTVLNYSNLLVQNAVMILEGKSPDFSISLPLNDIGPGQYLSSDFHLTVPTVNIPQITAKFYYKDINGTSYYSDPQPISVYLSSFLPKNTQQNSARPIFRIVGLVFSLILLVLWGIVFFIRLRKKRSL